MSATYVSALAFSSSTSLDVIRVDTQVHPYAVPSLIESGTTLKETYGFVVPSAEIYGSHAIQAEAT